MGGGSSKEPEDEAPSSANIPASWGPSPPSDGGHSIGFIGHASPSDNSERKRRFKPARSRGPTSSGIGYFEAPTEQSANDLLIKTLESERNVVGKIANNKRLKAKGIGSWKDSVYFEMPRGMRDMKPGYLVDMKENINRTQTAVARREELRKLEMKNRRREAEWFREQEINHYYTEQLKEFLIEKNAITFKQDMDGNYILDEFGRGIPCTDRVKMLDAYGNPIPVGMLLGGGYELTPEGETKLGNGVVLTRGDFMPRQEQLAAAGIDAQDWIDGRGGKDWMHKVQRKNHPTHQNWLPRFGYLDLHRPYVSPYSGRQQTAKEAFEQMDVRSAVNGGVMRARSRVGNKSGGGVLNRSAAAEAREEEVLRGRGKQRTVVGMESSG
eukprot:g17885.t1